MIAIKIDPVKSERKTRSRQRGKFKTLKNRYEYSCFKCKLRLMIEEGILFFFFYWERGKNERSRLRYGISSGDRYLRTRVVYIRQCLYTAPFVRGTFDSNSGLKYSRFHIRNLIRCNSIFFRVIEFERLVKKKSRHF